MRTMERQAGIPQGTHTEWEKKQRLKLKLLRAAITVLCAAVAVTGLLALILPTFRVKEIRVEGSQITPAEAENIRAASGIKEGDEMFARSAEQILNNVAAKYPSYGVRVRRGLSTVTITVTKPESAYIAYSGHWFLLDRELKVITMSDREEDFASYPRMILPRVSRLSVGKPVQFPENDINREYITALTDLLESEGLLSHVTYIDVSEKFHISYVLEGQIRVVVGELSDMDLKLEMAEQILGTRFENDAPYVIVDVSDPKKTTYRSMQTPDQLLTY